MDEGGGGRVEGERLSVKEEGSRSMENIMDPDPANYADPLDPDPDPQHCFYLTVHLAPLTTPHFLLPSPHSQLHSFHVRGKSLSPYPQGGAARNMTKQTLL